MNDCENWKEQGDQIGSKVSKRNLFGQDEEILLVLSSSLEMGILQGYIGDVVHTTNYYTGTKLLRRSEQIQKYGEQKLTSYSGNVQKSSGAFG